MTTLVLTREQFGKTQGIKAIRQFAMFHSEQFGVLCGTLGFYHVQTKTYVLFPHYDREKEVQRGPYRDMEHFLTESTEEDRTISGEEEALSELVALLDSLD